ncbi:MAG: hypothetical protein KGL91_03795 [Xanthomonadaceae bacterium]|nr:hypothetical protein [Xanthomonadaceae bacterium]
MRGRGGIVLACLACLLLAWWLAHPRHTLPAPVAGPLTRACPLPPSATMGAPPLQTDVPDGLVLPVIAGANVTPLAGFSVAARVLGRENYRFDAGATYSPMDLALGWGRMTDAAVLAQLQIRQSGRWYHYRWQQQPPIPVDEIVRSSANMHMVPANAEVAAALGRIHADDRIRIDGWLVRIDARDGWHWVSSLRRDDSGNGACELVYACAVTVL